MTSLNGSFGYRWKGLQQAYVVEQLPEQRPHVHLLLRHDHQVLDGDVRDIANRLSRKYRTGIFDLRPWATGSRGGEYLFKVFDPESYSNAESALAGIKSHLDINCGRMLHHSRKFFLLKDGEPASRRAVLAEVRDDLYRGGAMS